MSCFFGLSEQNVLPNRDIIMKNGTFALGSIVFSVYLPHFKYDYYSSSSSPSSYPHFYVGSMYDDIRLHVARSYTSSADSPFSLRSSFTLSNHLLLGLPLFLLIIIQVN